MEITKEDVLSYFETLPISEVDPILKNIISIFLNRKHTIEMNRRRNIKHHTCKDCQFWDYGAKDCDLARWSFPIKEDDPICEDFEEN